MKKIKLLIIGDSLSSERKENNRELIIWPTLVSNYLTLHVHNLSKPFQTSSILHKVNVTESHIILNLGLVDCAERKFTRFEIKFLSLLPRRAKSFLIKCLNRKPSIKRSYVNIQQYESYYNRFLSSGKYKKALLIGILPSSNESILSDVTKRQIFKYNKRLQLIAKKYGIDYLDTSKITCSDYYLNDGYHLSQSGHNYISEKVLLWVTSEK